MILHSAMNNQDDSEKGFFPVEMLALMPADDVTPYSGFDTSIPLPFVTFGSSDDDEDEDIDDDEDGAFDDMEDDFEDESFDDDEYDVDDDDDYDEGDDEDYDYDEDVDYDDFDE